MAQAARRTSQARENRAPHHGGGRVSNSHGAHPRPRKRGCEACLHHPRVGQASDQQHAAGLHGSGDALDTPHELAGDGVQHAVEEAEGLGNDDIAILELDGGAPRAVRLAVEGGECRCDLGIFDAAWQQQACVGRGKVLDQPPAPCRTSLKAHKHVRNVDDKRT